MHFGRLTELYVHEVDDLLDRPCGVGRIGISTDEALGFAFEQFQFQMAAGLAGAFYEAFAATADR